MSVCHNKKYQFSYFIIQATSNFVFCCNLTEYDTTTQKNQFLFLYIQNIEKTKRHLKQYSAQYLKPIIAFQEKAQKRYDVTRDLLPDGGHSHPEELDGAPAGRGPGIGRRRLQSHRRVAGRSHPTLVRLQQGADAWISFETLSLTTLGPRPIA